MTLLAFTKLFVLFTLYQLALIPICCRATQLDNLKKLIESRKSRNPPNSEPWHLEKASRVYVGPQEGLMEADKITTLPGQPNGVDFDQYAGYVTVDPKSGRALFYYFVESPQNSSTKPLVLWLNGGPGCSSLGYGAMEELGPFRVRSDGKTLYRNNYAWNDVANVIFLESPARVGFSYSNTSSDYAKTGDNSTADDSYTFLVNWLDRFPQYKARNFYITGESYAGHYVPQLAYTIVSRNKNLNQTRINLKGIAIGNAWIDDNTSSKGMYEYFWTHALNSDETHAGIMKNCDFAAENISVACEKYKNRSAQELGDLDIYNIYAPLCNPSGAKFSSSDSMNLNSQNVRKQVEYGLVNTGDIEVHDFDPCSDNYVDSYLNRPEVQVALHAKPTQWSSCTDFAWKDSPTTILPTIQQLIASKVDVWVYSGDIDGRVPVTSSRLSVNALNLPVEIAWHPWYSNGEVGGYVVGYKGLTLTTIRGAGHTVPSYEPERALTLISAFLQGQLPPIS